MFNAWKQERNQRARCELSISTIQVELKDMTKDELNFCISRFICEIRKQDGEEYPPKNVYEIVICLQLYLCTQGQNYKFLDDDDFCQLRNTLDNIMKDKTSKGLGMVVKKAQIITESEEELL